MTESNDGTFSATNRRSVLKLLGSAGVLGATGAGVVSLTGTAAAATVDISAGSPVTVTNDRGDVTSVTVDPNFDVSWSGMDDAVGKVFWLLEGSVDGGDFQPLYRATPWLTLDGVGTTGTLDGGLFSNRLGRPVVVADEDGKPDYDGFDFSGVGGVDRDSYLDGTSLSGADEYTQSGAVGLDGEVLQNNFPNENAGYYGAASDTAPFDNGDDGTTAATSVELRYTIELQRPNLGQLEYRIKNHGNYTIPSGYDSMSDQEKTEALADIIEGLRASDVDVGDSRIVMEGEDGNPAFDGYADGAGIPYDVLRNNADDHVGIIVETASFTVDVSNESADSGATGVSNPSAGDGNQP